MTINTEYPVSSPIPRLVWMIGPGALGVLAIIIVNNGNGWFTIADFVFFGVLLAVVLARYLDFQLGQPRTATGEPATPDVLRRYVPAALLLGLSAWFVANLFGNHG